MSLMRALETRDATLLPGRRDEAWRYSDLKGVVRAVPAPSPAAETPQGAPPLAEIQTDNEIVIVNGRAETFGFHAVAGLPRTLRLRIVSRATETAHQGVLTLDMEPGADLTLIETYEGEGAGYLSDFSLAVSLGEGARLERIVLIDEPDSAVSISQSQIELMPGARLAQTVIASGARLQRHETQVRHPGGGADVRLDGLYLLSGKRHTAGLELDVVGRITPQWEIYGSYTWVPVARIDAAGSTASATVGQRVGLTPRQSGAIFLSYQATSQLRVGLGAHGAPIFAA